MSEIKAMAKGFQESINKAFNRLFYIRSFQIVHTFFQSEEKARKWFRTKNPSLGMTSPDELVAKGRAKKVYLFVKNAAQENRPEITENTEHLFMNGFGVVEIWTKSSDGSFYIDFGKDTFKTTLIPEEMNRIYLDSWDKK